MSSESSLSNQVERQKVWKDEFSYKLNKGEGFSVTVDNFNGDFILHLVSQCTSPSELTCEATDYRVTEIINNLYVRI